MSGKYSAHHGNLNWPVSFSGKDLHLIQFSNTFKSRIQNPKGLFNVEKTGTVVNDRQATN